MTGQADRHPKQQENEIQHLKSEAVFPLEIICRPGGKSLSRQRVRTKFVSQFFPACALVWHTRQRVNNKEACQSVRTTVPAAVSGAT